MMIMSRPKKVTCRSGRTNSDGKAYSAYHDLDERLKLAKEYKDNGYQLNEHLQEHHIDVERINQNAYILPCRTKNNDIKLVNFDFNQILKNNPNFSLRTMELSLYHLLYDDELKAKNARYEASRHYEDVKTMEDVYSNKNTAPLETILQIGKFGDDVPRELFIQCVNDFVSENNRRYPQAPIIDVSIHCDEQKNAVNNLDGDYVAHAHVRQVFYSYDKDGNKVPMQDKALEDMGFDLANPEKKKSRTNNRLVPFTDERREIWCQIVEKRYREYSHDENFTIDREPSKTNRFNVKVRDLENKAIAEKNADLTEKLTVLTSEISAKREVNNQLTDDNQRLNELNEDKKRRVAHNSEILKKQRADYDEICKVRAEQLDAIKQGDDIKQGLKAEIMAMQQKEAELSEKLTVLTNNISEISGLYEKDFEQFINSNFFKTQMRDAKYQAFIEVMQEWKPYFLHPSNLSELNISREAFEKIIDTMITDVYVEEIAPLVENPVIETHEHERNL